MGEREFWAEISEKFKIALRPDEPLILAIQITEVMAATLFLPFWRKNYTTVSTT
jgi:hypothetical protein